MRIAAGYATVRSAALALDMPEVQLTQLETRATVLSGKTLHKLVNVLGIDPVALFAPVEELGHAAVLKADLGPAPKPQLRPEILRIVERNWPRDEEALRFLGR